MRFWLNICNFSPKYLHFSKIIPTFAPLEPAKPLNDAQMCGSFYFYTMSNRVPFQKSYTNAHDLVRLLQSRGLTVTDTAKAESYLEYIGYYRLSAYMYPLLQMPKNQHRYKPNTSFNQVMMLYRFDKKLRLLIFNEIEKIEVAVRSAIVNTGSEMTNDPFWMTDSRNFIDAGKFRHTDVISPQNDMKAKIDTLLVNYPDIDIAAMGFPQGWENEPVWQ